MTTHLSPKSVGICGGGKMGHSLFDLISTTGHNVIFYLRDHEKAGNLEQKWNRRLKRLETSGTHDQVIPSIRISTDIHSLKEADLIVEMVSEELKVKQDIITKLEGINDHGIIATGSSAIIPGKITGDSSLLSRFAGLHFFYPVPLTDYVEVFINPQFSDIHLNTIKDFLISINKKGIFLPETSGSILNKLLLYYHNEAFVMAFSEHIPPAIIDGLVEKYLLPIGPFRYFDLVGIDTMYNSLLEYVEGDPFREILSIMKERTAYLAESDCLGKKTGKGFYYYPSLRINEEFDFNENHFNKEEIIERLKLILVNTAFRFLQSGFLNYETLKGAAYQVFQTETGPLTIAEEMGIAKVKERLDFYFRRYGRYYEAGRSPAESENTDVKEFNPNGTIQ